MGIGLILIAVLIGSQIAHIIVLLLGTYSGHVNIIFTALIYVVMISIAIYICFLSQKDTYKRILSIMVEEKNVVKFINKCNYTCKWSIDSVLRSKLSIKLSEVYIQQGDYNLAYKTLTEVNSIKNSRYFNKYFLLPKSLKLEYYLKLIYINIKFNNIMDAQIAAENGHDIIELFKNEKEHIFDVRYTLALLEYSKGNYFEANELISFIEEDSVDLRDALNNLKEKINLKI